MDPKPLILAFLESQPLYGYELVRRAKAHGHLRWEEGTIYPLLHRMESERLLSSEWRRGPRGKERKYYALTPGGRRALESARLTWKEEVRWVSKILMGGSRG